MRMNERPVRLIGKARDERAQRLEAQYLGFIGAIDTPGLEGGAARQVKVGKERSGKGGG